MSAHQREDPDINMDDSDDSLSSVPDSEKGVASADNSVDTVMANSSLVALRNTEVHTNVASTPNPANHAGAASSSRANPSQDDDSDALSELDSEDFGDVEKAFEKETKYKKTHRYSVGWESPNRKVFREQVGEDKKYSHKYEDSSASAKVGEPDASKFTVTLMRLNGPLKGRPKIAHYQHQKDFDWDNPVHVKKLNAWMSQRLERAAVVRRDKARHQWTVLEADILEEIVLDCMKKVGNYRQLKWEGIADQFNEKMKGRWIEKGDLLAPTIKPDGSLNTPKSRPRIDPFGTPEEDMVEDANGNFVPADVKQPKRSAQKPHVLDRYEFEDRTPRSIQGHAHKLPRVLAAMNTGEFSDPELEASDVDKKKKKVKKSRKSKGKEPNKPGDQQGSEGSPSQEMGIGDDPRNYENEADELRLSSIRQIAKDKAGPLFWKGG